MKNGIFENSVLGGLGWDMPWDSVDAGAETVGSNINGGGGSGHGKDWLCDPMTDPNCIPAPDSVSGRNDDGTGWGGPAPSPTELIALPPTPDTWSTPTISCDPCDKAGNCYNANVCNGVEPGTTTDYIPTQSDLCNPASPYYVGEEVCKSGKIPVDPGKKIGPGPGPGPGPAPVPAEPPKSLVGGPSIFSSPWLWVGVAAVAAGGIIYATSRKPAPKKMTANGRRSRRRY